MDVTALGAQATTVATGLGTLLTTNASVIGLIGVAFLSYRYGKRFVMAIMKPRV